MQPYPRSPDLVWPGHLHGTGCLSARAMDTRFPTVVWVRVVFGLGFPLRPATPGWGDGVGVCLCARSACTPPLLAGVCGVGVCAWARVPGAPRHSWLGCWGVCMFVCPLRLYPATPGWGVWCGGVCLGSGFGCAPPLLAGVLGCVCACVRAPLLPRHSWLGCAASVCVLGLRFRLRPATPGWGVGVFVCLCVRSACTPPLLAGVCAVGVCAWAWVLPAPRLSWVVCWGVCVLVCPLRLYPATPGSGVWCECVCLGSRFGCAPPLLAGVLGCVCVLSRPPLVPRHSSLGCESWVCVLGLGSRLRPDTPGWGVWVCVCSCARSALSPPLLAGVSGACVCVRARVLAAPRHSWLGCWGVCVLVCPLRLYPATAGWGVWRECVCFGSGFGCAPPLLAGVLGCVCVRARAPLVPRHSWLGCAPWVCVLLLGFWLRPATPGWGVGVCVCLCARSACTPPLLAGVCGVGVCAWARVSAATNHSWLGCWGVFVCALRLYPATPGLGVRRGCVSGLGFWLRPATAGRGVGVCVCLCARSACTPPLLAGMFGVAVCAWAWVSAAPRLSCLGCWGVCVLVCPLRLFPATPGWGVWCACVCSGLGFGCAPPLLAAVLGCVCVRVPALLVPRHSWLGCVVWLCVLGLGFRLRPATLGWGVGVCVCVCASSACTPPVLAGVGGVAVSAWAWALASPRHSWLGCWGVCVCLCACSACTPPLLAGVCGVGVGAWARVSAAPRHSWLGCSGVCVFVCALRLYPATPGWGVRRGCGGWVLPGTCSCAVVRCVLCALPWFAAPGGHRRLVPVLAPWFWPAACLSGVPCGPALVCRASSGPVALGAPVGFPDAVVPFPIPEACAPGFTRRLRGARGGRPRTGLFVSAAGPCRGRGLASVRVVPVRGPAMGLSLAGPSGVGLGLRVLRWLACVDPVTDASGFLYRPSFDRGTRPVHRGCFVWTPILPLEGQRTPRSGPARVCVRLLCLAGSGGPTSRGRSGAPHLFLWSLCPCSLFGLLRAWVALFAVCFFFLPFVRPRCLWRSVSSGPGCLGPWRLVRPPPLFSFFFLFSFFAPPLPPFFFLSPWCFVPCVFFFCFCSVYWFFFCRLCGAVSLCVFVAVGCARV